MVVQGTTASLSVSSSLSILSLKSSGVLYFSSLSLSVCVRGGDVVERSGDEVPGFGVEREANVSIPDGCVCPTLYCWSNKSSRISLSTPFSSSSLWSATRDQFLVWWWIVLEAKGDSLLLF